VLRLIVQKQCSLEVFSFYVMYSFIYILLSFLFFSLTCYLQSFFFFFDSVLSATTETSSSSSFSFSQSVKEDQRDNVHLTHTIFHNFVVIFFCRQ
jgi:hypothetical protein